MARYQSGYRYISGWRRPDVVPAWFGLDVEARIDYGKVWEILSPQVAQLGKFHGAYVYLRNPVSIDGASWTVVWDSVAIDTGVFSLANPTKFLPDKSGKWLGIFHCSLVLGEAGVSVDKAWWFKNGVPQPPSREIVTSGGGDRNNGVVVKLLECRPGDYVQCHVEHGVYSVTVDGTAGAEAGYSTWAMFYYLGP